MKSIIARLIFALFLWLCVKYDGTGHKLGPIYALQLAFDKKFWGVA